MTLEVGRFAPRLNNLLRSDKNPFSVFSLFGRTSCPRMKIYHGSNLSVCDLALLVVLMIHFFTMSSVLENWLLKAADLV